MKEKTYRPLNVLKIIIFIIGCITFTIGLLLFSFSIESLIGSFLFFYITLFWWWEFFIPKIIIYQDKLKIYYLKSRGYKDPRLSVIIKHEIAYSNIKSLKVIKGWFYHFIEIKTNKRTYKIPASSYSPYMMNNFLETISKKRYTNNIDNKHNHTNYHIIIDFIYSLPFTILFFIITFIVPLTLTFVANTSLDRLNTFQIIYYSLFILSGGLLSTWIYSKYYLLYNIKNKSKHLMTRINKPQKESNSKQLFYYLIITLYSISIISLLIDMLS